MNLDEMTLFDFCARKHGGESASVAANRRMAVEGTKSSLRFRVLEAVREAGSLGVTCRELSERFGLGMNCLSGRFTELDSFNQIEKSGAMRDRCNVWVSR